jgi:hypothetical protein
MNKRDKELANQVTWYADVTLTELSRYAALIRADAMEAATRAANESWTLACKKMVEFEREACAVLAEKTICDTHIPTGINIYGTRAAKAIRARGNT